MVIDIKKLKKEGKIVYGFSFPVEVEDGIVPIPGVAIVGDVILAGEAEIVDRDVYVDAELTYTLKGECSRCLSEAEVSVKEPMHVRFVERDPEEDDYTYSGGVVDLTTATRECLMGSFPYVVLCKEDCKGLCPKCGCNLNESECNCEK